MKCEITESEIYLVNENQENKVIFLPANENFRFKEMQQILYPSSTVSVMKLLTKESIDSVILKGKIDEVVFSDNHSMDWFGPIILFTSTAIMQNPALVSMTINIISNYVYDIFKGKSNDPNVKCTFYYQDDKNGKKINYDGPVSGLQQVNDIIKEV